jgi:hypothetical protein
MKKVVLIALVILIITGVSVNKVSAASESSPTMFMVDPGTKPGG